MLKRRLRDSLDKNLFKNKVVLDIGTGVSSVKFLLECGASKIIAVTINENEINEVKKEITDTSKVQFVISDVTEFSLEEEVDVIFAGYFYSALNGTRTNSLSQVTKKLYSFLKDDGKIIIEEFYWASELQERQDELAKRLWDITYEVKDLIKKSYPIQIPESNVVEILKEVGFKNIEIITEELNRNKAREKIDRYKKQLESIKKHAEEIDNQKARNRYIKEAEDICTELEKIGKAAFFSYNYTILADK